MEASLLVIMLDWFKGCWMMIRVGFEKNVVFQPKAVCRSSTMSRPTFSTSAIVIDNQCSTGLIGGFFVTTIMTSPRIPILLRIIHFMAADSWIPIDTSSRSSHVTYKTIQHPAPPPQQTALLFARQSSHLICFPPSPFRLEHVGLTSLGRGSFSQFGQDHS